MKKVVLVILSLLLTVSVYTAEKAVQSQPVDPFTDSVNKLKSKDVSERRRAVEQLGSMRDQRAVEHLIYATKDNDAFVRSMSVEALGLMRAGAAIDVIISLLSQDSNENVRQSAAVALNYLGNRKAVPVLINALKDKHTGTRFAAANSLGSLRDPSSVPALLQGLKDVDSGMRRSCLYALGRMEDPSVLSGVRELLKDTDTGIKAEAIRICGVLKDKRSEQEFKKFLGDADPKIKLNAAQALSEIGSGEGLTVALEAIKSSDLSTKAIAISVLGTLGGEQSKAALEKAKLDTNPNIRDAAVMALERLKTLPVASQGKKTQSSTKPNPVRKAK